jgi:oligoribonuclease NrnB/cAMP/cGMP phosphodiesterase (DHH superfamily)
MQLFKRIKNDRIVQLFTKPQNAIFSCYDDEIVVFHHDDSDGKLSAHLIYENFNLKNTKRFVCCNYSTNKPTSQCVKQGDVVFIVDYCIPIDQFNDIVHKAKLVVFLDHHKTAIKMIEANSEYFENLVLSNKIILDIDMSRCGAKITSDWLSNRYGFNWNVEAVELVDKYDRWTGEDIRADYLNQFIYNSAMSYIGSDMWSGLLHDPEYLKTAIEIGKKFYDLSVLKNEIIYESFAKESEFHGLKISVIEGFGNSQLFGDHMEKYDACCVYHRTNNGSWQYSLYSNKPGSAMNEIAELYGGGGHPGASGFCISKKLF